MAISTKVTNKELEEEGTLNDRKIVLNLKK